MKPEHLAIAIAVITFLSQIGLFAWIKWSFERIAENAAEKAKTASIDALNKHNDSIFAHSAASQHNHKPLEEKLDKLFTSLSSLQTQQAIILERLGSLLSEHKNIVKNRHKGTIYEETPNFEIAQTDDSPLQKK